MVMTTGTDQPASISRKAASRFRCGGTASYMANGAYGFGELFYAPKAFRTHQLTAGNRLMTAPKK